MNKFGERLDDTTVRFERLLPGPIERVWEYITDGEKRAKWLAGGKTEQVVDGSIELLFHNNSLSPLPTIVHHNCAAGCHSRSGARYTSCIAPSTIVGSKPHARSMKKPIRLYAWAECPNRKANCF